MRSRPAAPTTDERHRGLVTGADDLERGRAARVGEGATGEEGTTPDRREILAVAGRETVREAADRAPAGVEEAGLAREGLAAVDDAHDVARALPRPRADDLALGPHPVELREVAAHALGDLLRVELGLDGDASGDDVQAAREAQERGELGSPHARLAHLDGDELILDVRRQCHALILISRRSSACL